MLAPLSSLNRSLLLAVARVLVQVPRPLWHLEQGLSTDSLLPKGSPAPNTRRAVLLSFAKRYVLLQQFIKLWNFCTLDNFDDILYDRKLWEDLVRLSFQYALWLLKYHRIILSNKMLQCFCMLQYKQSATLFLIGLCSMPPHHFTWSTAILYQSKKLSRYGV